jgi:hypothetical protein
MCPAPRTQPKSELGRLYGDVHLEILNPLALNGYSRRSGYRLMPGEFCRSVANTITSNEKFHEPDES